MMHKDMEEEGVMTTIDQAFHEFKGHLATSKAAEELIAAELDLEHIYNTTQQMNAGLEAYYNHEGHVRFFSM
ncbi:hypothetical protein ACFSTD_00710 [Novosphingobium colocasiae]